MRGILDTSVVIAADVTELPDEAAISVATLAELHFGIHCARGDEVRMRRLHRLAEVESRLEALPIDEPVARSYGSLAHLVRAGGRQPRARVMDILIAATAHAHRLPLYTHDRDDFRPFEGTIEIRRV